MGTTWFSDSLAQEKILEYLTTSAPNVSKASTSFLDLGTGNGEMLFALRGAGFGGEMLGVDYSAQSVELARRIASTRDDMATPSKPNFRVWDLLVSGSGKKEVGREGGEGEEGEEEEDGKGEGLGEWDMVLDKGTFDAVSLGGLPGVEEQYIRRVSVLPKPGTGILLLTSCNWTEEELRNWFEGSGDLDYYARIEYPTFRFGGKTGQAISSVCFKRRL